MTLPQKGRIFISYRRADSQFAAGRIYDRLAANFGEEAIFMDVEAIDGGVDFVKVLEKAVQSCDVVLVIIGKSWLNIKDERGERRLDNPEDFVRVEVATALNRDIRVIPVLVEGANMPRLTELPENLKVLARRNALQVIHRSFNADANRLIGHIERALEALEQEEKRKKEAAEKARKEQAEKARQDKIAREKRAAEEKDRQAVLREERQQELTTLLKKFIQGKGSLFTVGMLVFVCLIFGGTYILKNLASTLAPVPTSSATVINDGVATKVEETVRAGGVSIPISSTSTPMLTPSPIQMNNITVSVSVDTNCRSGPGVVYDFLGPLRVGEEAVVIGKYNDGEYWIIENPNAAGNCWLWGQYATLMGDSDGLTVLVPPPTPMPALGVGSTMISEKDSMTLVYVPAGEFQMGSEDGDDDEKPIHMVYLDAYWFDQTEVTNAMYAKCVAAGVCDEPRSTNSMFRESYYGNVDFNDYPVIYVSWYDSSAYCEWAGRRLPSEAEWEKVAGWDDDTQSQRIYPWGDDFEDGKSNFCDINCRFLGRNESYDDGYAETSPVGSYESGQSFYGAYDMAGNVWEWVDDWYDAYPGNTLEDSNYGTAYKVLRGGSWYDMNEPSLRSANRSRYYPSVTIGYDYDFRSANRSRYSSAVTRGGFDGFRCAYSP